jgi:hypothetical protein
MIQIIYKITVFNCKCYNFAYPIKKLIHIFLPAKIAGK